MGVRNSTYEGVTCLFDSVSGYAFGPVFDTADEAEDFVIWATDTCGVGDLRILTWEQMHTLHDAFVERPTDEIHHP